MATSEQFWSPAVGTLFGINGSVSAWYELNTNQVARAAEAYGLWNDVCGLSAPRAVDDVGIARRAANRETTLTTDWTRIAVGDIIDPNTLGFNQSMGNLGRYHQVIIDRSIEGISNFQLGSAAFVTLLHEIGHTAIGPHLSSVPYSENTRLSTVMNTTTNPSSSLWHASTPMTLDIDAAIAQYGASTTTRTGSDVYGFNAYFSGPYRSAFDFNVNTRPLVTIYDNGGQDTLDASGFKFSDGQARSVLVNLSQGVANASRLLDGSHEAFAVIYSTTWVEDAVTGDGDDRILGNSIGNILSAGGGHDSLFGFGGADSLFGGDGNDLMDGGIGADVIFGGAGLDTALMSGASIFTATIVEVNGTATINSAAGADAVGYDVEIVEFDDGQFARMFGTSMGDTLSAKGGGSWPAATIFGDSLYGYGGNDILNGGLGADRMFGGRGSDLYQIDSSGDLVSETDWMGGDSGGVDSVLSLISYALGEFVENLTLLGTDDLSGGGNDLANELRGNSGRNSLFGAAQSDVLIGGAGADLLDGGKGADRFVYERISDSTTALSGQDLISGFRHGEHDVIVLKAVDANLAIRGNQRFDFVGFDQFSRTAGELRVERGADGMRISADVTGDGRADFAIQLDSLSSFRQADLVL